MVTQITAEDAEELSQALGQSGQGWWRTTARYCQMGVPEALGLTWREWAQKYHAYMRMPIPERQQAVVELTAPIEEGGEGLSNVKAAEVLGVSEPTVRRDRASSSDEVAAADRTQGGSEASSNDEVMADEVYRYRDRVMKGLSSITRFCSEFDPREVAEHLEPSDWDDFVERLPHLVSQWVERGRPDRRVRVI